MSEIEVRQPSKEELDEMNVSSWPTWGCDVSSFDWSYPERETGYILEGEVQVLVDGQVAAELKPGDLVVFPEGLSCHWRVTKPVRKHYKMG